MKENIEQELTIEEETVRDCPILYQMKYRPCTETCMCWGWEFNHGWDDVIARASRKLELLNMQYYPRYRVRIQADQIKEKYGTLRFYYSVTADPNRFITWLAHKFENIYRKYSDWDKYNYKLKSVVDIEPFDYDDTSELSKEEYDELTASKSRCSNVEYKEENGKYFKIIHLRNYGRSHNEPTRHKFLWRYKETCNKIYHWLMYCTPKKDTAAVRNCISALNDMADEIIRKAEDECSKTCEICGYQIGTSWSPTCMTAGWIKYICTDCAEKYDSEYYKNGELWQGKTRLKSKKELADEKNRVETGNH